MNASAASQAASASRKPTPFLWALLIVTVLVISRVHGFLGVLLAMRPVMLLVMFAGASALLQPQVTELRNISRSWPPKVVLGLAVTACFSVLFGISMGRAGMFFLTDYWKTILYAMLLVVAMKSTRDMTRIIWAVVIGVGTLAYVSLFILGISKTQDIFSYDSNDVGLIMVAGLPLVLLTVQASKGIGRVISIFTAVLVVGTIAKSESRGAFVALIAVGIGLMFFFRGVSVMKKVVFGSFVAITLVFAAPQGYGALLSTLHHPEQDYNWSGTNGRLEIAKRGLSYMMRYPFFGIGIDNFEMAEGVISVKAQRHMAGTGLRWAAPHNSYVQVGSEMGIPGFILWSTLVLGGMYHAWSLSRKMPSRWKRGSFDQRWLYFTAGYLPVSLAGFAIASFFVSFAYLEPIYILSALVAGLQIFASQALRAERLGAGAVAPRTRSRRMSARSSQRPRAFGESRHSGIAKGSRA